MNRLADVACLMGLKRKIYLTNRIQNVVSLPALGEQAPSISGKKSQLHTGCYYLFPNSEKSINSFGIAPLQDLALPRHKTKRPGYLRHLALATFPTWCCETPALPRATWLPQAGTLLGLCLQQDPRTALQGYHLNFASTKTPNHSPETPPAQQEDANLQSGLLAPYAISTQDTAKQALKGNQSHEFLTNSLTHSQLQLLPSPQRLAGQFLLRRREAGNLEREIQGNTQILLANKYYRQALHKGWGRSLSSQH